MNAIVSLKDVIGEIDMLFDEHTAFLNRKTGELVTLSHEDLSAAEMDEDLGEYSEDMIEKAKEVLDSDDYLSLPDKFDIHEYNIMEKFCYSVDDERVRENLLNKIKGSGAFGRFKDAIYQYHIEESWYSYRHEKLKQIAIDWLDMNQISYSE